jgi:hypothetical protein
MAPIKRRNGYRNGIIRLEIVTVAAIALLLPNPIHSESALASIRAHRGINLDSFHINERGGAVATGKRIWKRRHPVNTLPHGETEYWLEPVQKYVRSIFDGEAAPAPKAVISTSGHKQQNKEEGLTTAAITCESSRVFLHMQILIGVTHGIFLILRQACLFLPYNSAFSPF